MHLDGTGPLWLSSACVTITIKENLKKEKKKREGT